MLNIDFSLIPLSPEDQNRVEAEVARKLASGTDPKIEKSHFGRVVVLNPDPVQSAHHVPDVLRSSYRRIMFHVHEGPLQMPADKIFAELTEPEEPLRILIIEVKDPFKNLSGFLRYLPQLRKKYPDLGVFLNANMLTAMKTLQQVMASEGDELVLIYPDARGMIEIQDPEELSQVVTDIAEPITFSVPFFSQIRLADESGEVNAYNLDTLKRLHPKYGVGGVKEVDMGLGKKEKMVVLDIPVRLIKDFQFRQDRGLDFQGIFREGRRIQSRNFEKQKLEFRWIPFRSIESFVHQPTGAKEKQALVAQAKLLRVNCFNGNTSFIMRSVTDQISLDDVQSIGFRKKGTTDKTTPQVRFDRLVLPVGLNSDKEPIQETIREFVFGNLFRKEAEERRKLEIYTSRIKVGAVGPLAAQSLKIFRRYGLERLIQKDSFHYLCDLPQQLPTYFDTPVRFEQNFRNLIQSLRDIAKVNPSDKIRIDDYAYNIPVTLEWVDSNRMEFQFAPPQEMEVIYNEMNSLIHFIGHEFRRNYNIQAEEFEFFSKIRACQNTGLMARWMADYKRGAYGPPLPPGSAPDFVFFGTPADKAQNDKDYFFPSLACSELLSSPQAQQLFANVDYGFSVFLEEQMALAEHAFREAGQFEVGLMEFLAYFDQKQEDAQKEHQELKTILENIDSTDSPEYRKLLEEEEAAYRQRYQEFLRDLDRATRLHEETAHKLVDALKAFGADLRMDVHPPPDWFSSEFVEPGPFDRQIETSLDDLDQRRMTSLETRMSQSMGRLQERITALKSAMNNLVEAGMAHREWQKAQGVDVLAGNQKVVHDTAIEKMPSIRAMTKADTESNIYRVRVQRGGVDTDGKRLQEQMQLIEQRSQSTMRSMQGVMERMMEGLVEISKPEPTLSPDQKKRKFESYLNRLEKVFINVRGLANRIITGWSQTEELEAKRQRLTSQKYALGLEFSMLKAHAEVKQIVMPDSVSQEERERLTRQSEARHLNFKGKKAKVDQFVADLTGMPKAFSLVMGEIEAIIRDHDTFRRQITEAENLASRKKRLRTTSYSLVERQKLMDEELKDLPRRVKEKFVPARKELMQNVFIPEVEKKIGYFRRSKVFLNEIHNLDIERLSNLFLDRAVYRRFSSNQFIRGALITAPRDKSRAMGLLNFQPAINSLSRELLFNYSKQHPQKSAGVILRNLKPLDDQGILDFVQVQSSLGEKADYDYIILPATITLDHAIDIMAQKDRQQRGIPRPVLIYVGKFSSARILEEPRLREEYFRAVKHNIIVNIEGHALVDNPQAIAFRLLNETLGGTFDTDVIEEIADEEKNVKFRV